MKTNHEMQSPWTLRDWKHLVELGGDAAAVEKVDAIRCAEGRGDKEAEFIRRGRLVLAAVKGGFPVDDLTMDDDLYSVKMYRDELDAAITRLTGSPPPGADE